MSDNLIPSHPSPKLRSQEGDNCDLGDEHNETEQKPQLGTDDECSERPLFDGSDGLLKTECIVERFLQHPTMRMAGKGTRKSYSGAFRRFAKKVNLDKYTRRQVATSLGKRLILEYIVALPLRSRQIHLSGLAKVWKLALDLPWPIDNERDVGRLPKTRRGIVPPDDPIKEWHERLHDEPNPYLRFIWLEIGNAGHRPNTVVKLKWRHIRYDEQGMPSEIRLNGADEGTKRDADVAWWLPAEVSKTLTELRTMLREPEENDPILPWMDGWGDIQQHREMTENHLRNHWERLRSKYNLPKLTMRDVRHWVSGKCKDARLEEQARAYLMGHEQPINDMGDVYDNRPIETNLARQQEKFPHGPLGVFSKVNAELVNEVPDGLMTALLDYRDGRMKSTDLLDRLETWRLKSQEEALRVHL